MNLKKGLSGFLATAVLASGLIGAPSSVSAEVSDLPTNVVIGYWENWTSSDNANLTLRQVDENWDVINVSFLLTGSSGTTRPTFSPDTSLYSSDAAFISDIEYCRSRGQKVLISLGGAQGGDVKLSSTSDRDTCLASLVDCFDTYGFDGIDIDLENSCLSVTSTDTLANPTTPMQIHMEYILRQLAARYGDDFMITMAPEHPYVQGGALSWGGYYGGYLPLIDNVRDILTFIHPQYYNNPIQGYDGSWGGTDFGFAGYNAESLVGLSEMLINGFDTFKGERFEGLDPSQVAIGVPCSSGAAGSGYLAISEYQSAFATLLQKYPTFRGMMTWSINYDASQNNAFAIGMAETIAQYGQQQTIKVSSVACSATENVKEGATVTWTAQAENSTGDVTYKFDLYKDGVLVKEGNYSSSNTYTATLEYGTYKVVVTVKDSENTAEVTSAELIAEQIIPLSITKVDVSGTIVGAETKVTVTTTGGNGGNVYSIYLTKGGKVYYSLGKSYFNSATLTLPESGTYALRVYVTDCTGKRVVNASSVTVN